MPKTRRSTHRRSTKPSANKWKPTPKKTLSAAEKVRERRRKNREHAKKSRERKKQEFENMTKQIEDQSREICALKTKVELQDEDMDTLIATIKDIERLLLRVIEKHVPKQKTRNSIAQKFDNLTSYLR